MGNKVKQCDVAVIGAGPAGLSAAIQLAQLGVDTLVLDEKPAAGGQLFKQIHKFFGSQRHMAGVRGFQIGRYLIDRCKELAVPIYLNTAAWGIFPDKTIAAQMSNQSLIIKAEKIIIATGASENALAFPGWTLPGVMGAGAAQTLVNFHRVRPGNHALVVGSGNVGLIVAYQLLQAGIEVVAVIEGLEHVGGYTVHAAKIRRMGVPIYTRSTILRAEGQHCVRRCTIVALDQSFTPVSGTEKHFDVDLICIAVGLSPAVELPCALGTQTGYVSELGGCVPLHDQRLATSIDGVYVAGDASGIEEASSAMEEGKQAAVSAATDLGKLSTRTAEKLIQEIQGSLKLLRTGPFGAMIKQKKQEIFESYEQRCPKKTAST